MDLEEHSQGEYSSDYPSTHDRNTLNPWLLEEWRRTAIPAWRRILQESIQSGDNKREVYARWMLNEVLEADDD